MVKRTRFDGESCPVARSVDAVGDWWSLLIVQDAFDGSRRFGDFQRSLGVAKNILSARLRALVDSGILEQVPAGARHEYVLTPKGEALFPVVVALRQWGEAFAFDANEPHSQLLDRRDRQPLRPLEVHAADGRLLTSADTEVRKELS
ncbi:DNA-binding HxlR family transcriptional regulator [Kribbella aluminosa]|uniref:DNA-binding HxlR family transcriptional regulator n=1 Tax=Kribbella aluminosa TaxID=416017 RepID=A0ABS4UE31_9ACTN|nr:helix-turn-helix domain-containing protein [Kribbella aluminosa]MBP2349903.1 DNA-binding HxlR family transcriptional regulator [Kribbella aluminosa]